MLVDRDFKVVKDTYNVDEGKILISPKVVKCFKSGEATDYRQYGQTLELAVPVRSADCAADAGCIAGKYFYECCDGYRERTGAERHADRRNHHCAVDIPFVYSGSCTCQTAGESYKVH